jgi:hypothetical protein
MWFLDVSEAELVVARYCVARAFCVFEAGLAVARYCVARAFCVLKLDLRCQDIVLPELFVFL